MFNHRWSKLPILLLALLLISSMLAGCGPDRSVSGSQFAADAADYLLSVYPQPGYGSEWTVYALSRLELADDNYFQTYYQNILDLLDKEGLSFGERRYTEYAKLVITLSALGYDARNIAGYDLTACLGEYEAVLAQGINGAIYALLALQYYPGNEDMENFYCRQILSLQLTDGGYAMSGTQADPDITAMVVRALAPYRQEDEAIADAVSAAVECLALLQNPDGTYTSWGVENSESLSQVIMALAELDLLADERFAADHDWLDRLNRYRLDSGGYGHIRDSVEDTFATEQALLALAVLIEEDSDE